MSATTPCVFVVTSQPSQFATLSTELSALEVCTRHAATPQEVGAPDESAACVILCDADSADWNLALRVFRERQPGSPVVFLTRLADEYMWIQMLEAGAYDLIEKPYRVEDLCWIVSGALKRGRSRSNSAVA